jgi:hypothetical protein
MSRIGAPLKLRNLKASIHDGIRHAPPTAMMIRAIWSCGWAIRASRPNTRSE